jgi:hypothetical protein
MEEDCKIILQSQHKMIKERYVSREVAMLLKDKGFEEQCRAYYNDDGALKIDCTVPTNWNGNTGFYNHMSAPTQQMACDWMQTKDVLITYCLSSPFDSILRVKVYRKDYDLNWSEVTTITRNSLEDAINDALEFALTNSV